MKKQLTFLLLLSIFACQNDEPLTVDQEPSDDTDCSIEVYAYSCPTVSCNERIPFVQKEVGLYATYEEALAAENRLRLLPTSEEGKALFTSLPCGKIYLRIDTEHHGCYISSDLLYESAKSHHDARFVDGYSYDKNDNGTINQRQISLDDPVIGQLSTYRYHVTHSFIDFNIPSYTDNVLTVAIIDKLDDNSYLIEETIDSIYQSLFWGNYPEQKKIRNIWSFQDDSLHVLPYKNEFFGSFIWNLNSDPSSRENMGWSFSLVRPEDNFIDMSNNVVTDIIWGMGHASDYDLLGTTYTDLITENVNYTGWDGPLKFRVYNRKYGLIRSLNFFGGMSHTTQGFDLVLE